MVNCSIKHYGCTHACTHRWKIFRMEAIQWGLFLAIWIVDSVDLSCDTQYCVAHNGDRLFTKPCNCYYAAYALSLFAWLLFSTTFAYVSFVCISEAPKPMVHEKGCAEDPPRMIGNGQGRGMTSETV